MRVNGERIPEQVIQAAIAFMKSRKVFNSADITSLLEKHHVFENYRAADRILQRERKAGNIRFGDFKWKWVGTADDLDIRSLDDAEIIHLSATPPIKIDLRRPTMTKLTPEQAIGNLKWIRIQCDSQLKKEIDRIISLLESLAREAEMGAKFEKACIERSNKENKCWNLNTLNELYGDFCRLHTGKEAVE